MVKGFSEFINERFEEMDQPGFFGKAKRGIKKFFSGEPKFGEENPFSTIDQIVGALVGDRASLRVKQDEGVAGGWVEVGGRERSFVLDIDERGMTYDGREIGLDREQAEMLWTAVTDWDDRHNPKSQLDWED